MPTILEKRLNESQRDALVAAYFKFVGPTLKNAAGSPLTAEDLYEYLLLDPEISDDVTTSRVASAIASVQTYMTRIVNRSEPGFNPVDPSQVDEWRDNDDQYSVWAAGMDVQNYAENYISPPTRLEKSHYFGDLESALNQNQLDPDRVQVAALAYLNEFEAVSNLQVLSGYISEQELSQATYYFVGRTTTKPYRYYWRQMDLSKNREDYQGNPVTPNCWSDWLPVSLPLAGDTVLENTVRPVFYNQRLYVAWVERNPSPQKDSGGTDTPYYAYRLNFGYKRFDDTWTAPNSTTMKTHQSNDQSADETDRDALLIDESAAGFGVGNVNLLAITDFSDDGGTQEANPYGRLMLGAFVADFSSGSNGPAVYGYLYCDSAFNNRPLDAATRAKLFACFKDNTTSTGPRPPSNTLQYPLYTYAYSIDHVDAYGPGDTIPGGDQLGSGDLHGSNRNDESYQQQWWQRINDLVASDSGTNSRVYIEDGLKLQVEMTLNADFLNDYFFQTTELESNDGTSGFGYVPYPNTEPALVFRYHGSDVYTMESAGLAYNPTAYGNGFIPDGTWYSFLIDWPDSGSVWCSVDIQNNKIRRAGTSGDYQDVLVLSGATVDNATMADQISNKVFRCAIAADNLYTIATIANFDKVGDTRQFNAAVRVVAEGVDGLTSGAYTFGLKSDSGAVVCTQQLPLSASMLPGSQPYVSVCLIVADIQLTWPGDVFTGHEAVWKWFKVYINTSGFDAPAALPQIKSNYDSKLGLAQYIDFCDASLPANTRLNTTFVRTLIDKASVGLDSLLDYALQTELLEAPLVSGDAPEPMDFNGANGLYFWELFFHMPFLVAWRFANEQQFADAQQWMHYIFDPSQEQKADGAPDYWNVRPLMDQVGESSYMLVDPLDPDTQAYAHPEIYRKAVFMAYADNLVAQGDQWYRQLTRDGLTQARVFYNLAYELLGPRPDVTLSSTWTPKTLDVLASSASQNAALRTFELSIDAAQPGIVALAGSRTASLRVADNSNFGAPLNTLMLAHWDTLDARLSNLRNNLTLDGKPMSLPLYESPADPVALLVQRAQSGNTIDGISGMRPAVPPYRFNAILPRAYNAVAALSRFGDNLLSLLERGDGAAREELQQQQLLDMASYGITLQQQEIDALAADQQALLASRAVALNRYDSYHALYQENISANEQLVMDTQASAQILFVGSQAVMAASGALKLIPNIFGLADGGSRYEGATEAVASGLLASGQAMQIFADRLGTTEGYRRRREDWQIQYEQAQAEMDQIDRQLDALAIRQSAAQTELLRLKAQQAQIQAMLSFLKNRFTQSSLYQWLSGQLAGLYYQVYDVVVAQCLAAQACWQYELGDFQTTFIQTGAWNDHYRGLQVGETMQLNLQQMEAAYLTRNERRLEITRTVSLVDLLTPSVFATQKAAGQINFDLGESLYDQDYPGHYMRQIRSISISLPTLLGPYQDVKATLTQTRNSILFNANLDGVKYLDDPNNGMGGALIGTNFRPSQQIALSSGLNDAGLFELNFGDDRYLPFEGTGAVSSWTLAFPRHDKSPTQQALLAALTDVIVHVRYTALDGGATFAQGVEGTLGS